MVSGLAWHRNNRTKDAILGLTTDFRAVFSELASKHLDAAQLPKIFVGYGGFETEWLGVL